MKKICYIFCGLLLVLYGCKSTTLNAGSTDYDFKFDLYSQIKIKNVTGREELLRHLLLYKKDISFQLKKNSMLVLWKNKKWFEIELDLCEMITDNSYTFTYFYDSSGNYRMDFEYEEDFNRIRKEIRDKFMPDTTFYSKYLKCLLRYDRTKGYLIYCPSKIRLRKIVI